MNRTLLSTWRGRLLSRTTTRNSEAAPAYAYTAEHALAQLAATGCLNRTFYATAEEQLDAALSLAARVDVRFAAQAAVYARREGHMKDLPALLLAVVATRDVALAERVFPLVVDSGRMLRGFVQVVRSGVVGRKSFGTALRRTLRTWLAAQTDEAIFAASVGNQPSLADVIRMVHPRPETASRRALYASLVGREYVQEDLPPVVQAFEAFKRDPSRPVPDVPFQMLTSLPLGPRGWTEIARRASWQQTRQHLNTFARHGVFEEEGMAELVAERLARPEAVRRARVLPYQLLVAARSATPGVPEVVLRALAQAAEVALANVPVVEGRVAVAVDVSGSMLSPVTGYRKGATTQVRCIDVAALFAAALLNQNPGTLVLPFAEAVRPITLGGSEGLFRTAERLAALGGGGTNCSAPLALLNKRRMEADLVVLLSDNESWVDARPSSQGTALLQEWETFRQRNPRARLVCLDLQPGRTTQALDRADVLNVGGFSDRVFSLVETFAKGELAPGYWQGVIERVPLPAA